MQHELHLVGCATLLLELFCGALVVSAMAASAGWPISQPTDIAIDGFD